MKILFHKKFQRFVQKQKDPKLVKKIKNSVDIIIQDKKIGKQLEHPFRKYHIQTVKFSYQKNEYRIAYTYDKNKENLIFLLIDSRENFYDKLERMV